MPHRYARGIQDGYGGGGAAHREQLWQYPQASLPLAGLIEERVRLAPLLTMMEPQLLLTPCLSCRTQISRKTRNT